MASIVIGSLRVDLSMNSAQFQKGAKQAQSTLGTLGGTIKAFAQGALAALSVGAITKAITTVVNMADEMGKSAQKIGIPVEALSRLQYAAKLSNVEIGTLSTGMNKFNKGLAAIAGGGGADAAKALRAIGVSAVDANGKLRPTQDVLLDVADKFKGYADGAGKSALAAALFGKSAGPDLIPLLNEGREGITTLMNEASIFGQVISSKFAADADTFNDNIDKLIGAGKNLTTQLVEHLLPGLVDVTNQMVEMVQNGGAEAFFVGLKQEIATTTKELRALGEAWTFLTEGSEGFRKMVADAKAKNLSPEDILKRNAASASALNFGAASPVSGGRASAAPLPAAPIIAATHGLTDQEKALKKLGDTAQSVWDQTRTPLEEYQLKIRELNDLLQAGQIDHETYNRAVLAAKEAFAETGDEAKTLGQELQNVLGNQVKGIFEDLISGSFNLTDALGSVLKKLTEVSLNSAFDILSNPSPHQAGGGLGSLFKSLLGFASGGTIMPGGSGGIDSQLVAFRKSPNERVDITKPGQRLQAGRGDLNVVVQNFNGSQIETKRDDSSGRLLITVKEAFKGMVQDGTMDRPMKNRFQQTPTRITRS